MHYTLYSTDTTMYFSPAALMGLVRFGFLRFQLPTLIFSRYLNQQDCLNVRVDGARFVTKVALGLPLAATDPI